MNYETILFFIRDGVATLTLNRPDKLNSFNQAMHDEVRHALRKVAEDKSVRVLVLSGGLMLWLRYGGVDGMNMWFWVKMALVVVIILALITSVVGRGRVHPAVLGWVTRLSLLGVVIAAVLAFN